MEFTHVSVMVREAMRFLKVEPSRRYLDGTLGGGGHTESILIESSPDGAVLGLDRDEDALAAAAQRFVQPDEQVQSLVRVSPTSREATRGSSGPK